MCKNCKYCGERLMSEGDIYDLQYKFCYLHNKVVFVNYKCNEYENKGR